MNEIPRLAGARHADVLAAPVEPAGSVHPAPSGTLRAASPAGTACQPIAALEAGMLACRVCRDEPVGCRLPHEPRPIFRVSPRARIVIASQAPGARAHASGIPFDDPSGRRLREWLGIGPDIFYDVDKIAIIPMGFCFPGYDEAKGDRPPRPECRAVWHDRIFAALPAVELILTIGVYAMRYHMERLDRWPEAPRAATLSMTDLVSQWQTFLACSRSPLLIPLPHPSWRNSGWLNRNPWFAQDLLPVLRAQVERLTLEA